LSAECIIWSLEIGLSPRSDPRIIPELHLDFTSTLL